MECFVVGCKKVNCDGTGHDEMPIKASSGNSEFRSGAKAMFDLLRTMTANHFHGDPEKDLVYQRENELFDEWVEDAFDLVSPEDCKGWRSLNDMYQSGFDNGCKSIGNSELSAEKALADITEILGMYEDRVEKPQPQDVVLWVQMFYDQLKRLNKGEGNSELLDFGDYCEFEQKRYGADNEIYRYKVIGRSNCNYYRPVPVDAHGDKKVHGEMCDVVKVICCGVMEETVETFRVQDIFVRALTHTD